jgi:carbonic anhydrase/acetyltransferase-like protein (isoleucine patch superfamily)
MLPRGAAFVASNAAVTARVALGEGASVWYGASVRGDDAPVRIEDRALVGMGAILLGGSVVGEGAVVAAGALVREGQVVPPYTLVAGVPARELRALDRAERDRAARESARGYLEKARAHAAGAWETWVDA